MITIEKNVPIPAENGYGARKYPFSKMDVGDSFVADSKTAVGCAYNYGQRNGKKFKTTDLKNGTYRIWRIK